jgi:hypothetical protein
MSGSSSPFAALLRQPAGEAKAPEALPVSSLYPGVVRSFEYGNANKNKTPYIRFQVGLTGWAEDVEAIPGLDITKRTFRRDVYMTPDSMHRIDTMLASFGLELSGRSYEEVIPEMVGQHVHADIQQYTSDTAGTLEVKNQCNAFVPQA